MKKTWTLDKIIYEFNQEGNTDGTTSENEQLTVEIQGCLECITKEGGYLVLRTSTGWSVNDSNELEDLCNVVKDGVKIIK